MSRNRTNDGLFACLPISYKFTNDSNLLSPIYILELNFKLDNIQAHDKYISNKVSIANLLGNVTRL